MLAKAQTVNDSMCYTVVRIWQNHTRKLRLTGIISKQTFGNVVLCHIWISFVSV